MKIKVLGWNDMFTYGCENLTLIEFDEIGKTLAIEAPYHINKHIDKIDGVLFTHIDTDHVGGLETFLFRKFYEPNQNRPVLCAKAAALDEFADTVNLTMLRERDCNSSFWDTPYKLDRYADCYRTEWWHDTEIKEMPGVVIRQPRKQSEHGAMTTSAFTIRFEDETILAYSGDTIYDPMLLDELFMDEYFDFPVIHEVAAPYDNHPCHTSIDELAQLPIQLRKRIYVNHIPKHLESIINCKIKKYGMHHVKELNKYEYK